MIKVLILSQAITQTYYDLLLRSLPQCEITLLTGSNIHAERIVKVPPHNPLSLKSRLFAWVKYFLCVAKWAKKNRKQKFDLVYATSNPPINSFICLKLSKLFKSKSVFMNWDLYPQVIESSINNPITKLICKLWRYWNNKNYSKIDKILTLGDGMAESINEYMDRKIPVEVIPLGVDVNYLRPVGKEKNEFCLKNKIDTKFIILYSGKMGRGHNIELILRAASKLEEYSDILFLFIGSGEKRPLVEKYISEKKTKNVKLMNLQNENIFPFSQASGDLCLVSQEKKMAKLFMPSKAYSALSCGQGIIGICSENDDLGKLIVKYNVGKVISEDNGDYLANCILYFYKHPKELNDLGNRARLVAEKYFSLEKISCMYRTLFESIL